MLMMTLPIKQCQNYLTGLISLLAFPDWDISLNLQKVMLLLMINGKGKVKLLLFLVIYWFRLWLAVHFLVTLLETIVRGTSMYVTSKVWQWVEDYDVLSEAALIQLQLFKLCFQHFCSMNGLTCYMMFRSVASFFSNLKCYFFSFLTGHVWF